MRLDEIKAASAAERRAKVLQANAKAANDSAKHLKTQAEMTAARLDMQKSREKLTQLQGQAVTSTIKPSS